MFEKQFYLNDWVEDLEVELENLDFLGRCDAVAASLASAIAAYREANSKAERRRVLAFLVLLAAKFNQNLAARLVEETPD